MKVKAKLYHHSSEWLPGEFQVPKAQANSQRSQGFRVHYDAPPGYVAMKLERATGVWDKSGSLLLYVKRGADMAWSRDFNRIVES